MIFGPNYFFSNSLAPISLAWDPGIWMKSRAQIFKPMKSGVVVYLSGIVCGVCGHHFQQTGRLLPIMVAKSFFYASILTKSIAHKVEIMLPFMLAFSESVCSIYGRHVNLCSIMLLTPTQGHTDA